MFLLNRLEEAVADLRAARDRKSADPTLPDLLARAEERVREASEAKPTEVATASTPPPPPSPRPAPPAAAPAPASLPPPAPAAVPEPPKPQPAPAPAPEPAKPVQPAPPPAAPIKVAAAPARPAPAPEREVPSLSGMSPNRLPEPAPKPATPPAPAAPAKPKPAPPAPSAPPATPAKPAANVEAVHQQARKLLADRKFAEAIPLLDQVLAASPNHVLALNARGYARMMQRDLTNAIADFEAALKVKPDYTNAQHNLSTAKRLAKVQ